MNAVHTDNGGFASGLLLVDAHVHVHDCFDLERFLDSAAGNFAGVASGLGAGAGYRAVLCLTETRRANKFAELVARAEDSGSGWNVIAGSEPVSVTVEHPELGSMHIVAGRQIVTAERLEVLALGYADCPEDGDPMADVIDSVTAADALAVLPWGFGKWLGGRGRFLRSLIGEKHGRALFLGDNSGRPAGFREPAEFDLARGLGMRVLPGTDPLPFASECERAGSFGFMCRGTISDDRPWSDLRGLLLRPDVALDPYGRLESPLRFMRNQVAMQYYVRAGRGAA